MSDVTFGTWSAASSPITIEYSLVVLEEIRHEVAEGFQKLSRGGIEVGGVLYGVREGQTVRIMAIRPVSCEHAAGPSFRLSERDRAALHEQIREDLADQRLEDLLCLGWYVSHTRTEITLTESDQEIFSTFFGQPWQVTLVVRPSRGGNMRAGFFVREPDGTVNSSQSYLEFNFPDRLAAAFDRRSDARGEQRTPFAGRERQAADRGVSRSPRVPAEPPPAFPAAAVPAALVPASLVPAPVVPAPVVSASAVPAPDIPFPRAPVSVISTHASRAEDIRDEKPPTSSRLTSLFGEPGQASILHSESPEPGGAYGPATIRSSKKWLLLAAGLIAVAGLAAGARFLSIGQSSEAVTLSVLEREGQLDIEWNRQAAQVAKALGGRLEIADGPQTRTIQLTPADLALGKVSYKRDTGDIQVRMIVDEPGGEKVQKASRFFGTPPPKANEDELKSLQKRKDELDAEVGRLKQSNNEQAQRIQQLERTLKILQTRQGN